MDAAILSYSRSRGLFAGLNVNRIILRPEDDLNMAVYTKTARELLSDEVSGDAGTQAGLKSVSAGARHPERKAVLDALDGVQDAVWFCILSSAKAINRVMANTVMDDPTPNSVLDEAVVAELARFGDGPTPGV